MFRVPADTVLTRFLTAAALAATLAVSACGEDSSEKASTPAASSPATTAAPATTGAPGTPAGGDAAGPDVPSPDEPTAAEAKAAIEKTKKVAREASKGVSTEKKSTKDLTQQVKAANDALKVAGLQVSKPIVDGEDGVALSVENSLVTVVFMRSPRDAAAAGAAAETNFAQSPQKIKVARKANRLFILSLPSDPTAKQLKTFRQVRKIVNASV